MNTLPSKGMLTAKVLAVVLGGLGASTPRISPRLSHRHSSAVVPEVEAVR